MNIEERKKRNEELKMNAPIPEGVEDLRGITWENKHNKTIIKIVRTIVSDVGTVMWYSDTGIIYLTRELNNHWIRLILNNDLVLEEEE